MGSEPPFTGVAVNITGMPWQTGFEDAVMETLTVTKGITIIVIELELQGFPVAHVALDVTRQ
jgi:hypothetical protein